MDSAPLRQLPLWEERSADWQVRRSPRARRLAVRVFRDGGVEIVVPERTSAAQVQAFVARHRDWILRQQQRHAPPALDFPPATLELAALGERWECLPGGAGRGRLRSAEHAAGHGGRLWLPEGGEPQAIRAALARWLVQRAADTLPGPLLALAEGLGFPLRKVQVRSQRTRWGSCSTRGTITLNVCLLFQRPEVVHYLYLHELTHLRHMNHSDRFWAAVARLEPAWRELDAELARGWQRVPGWLLAQMRA